MPTAGSSDASTPCGERSVLGLVVGADAALRLHGRTLATHAATALSEVPDVRVVVVGGTSPAAVTMAPDERWRSRAARALLLHDARCPLLPASAVQACLERLATAGNDGAVVGIRPVTDTIKRVLDGTVASTVDRDTLAALASPVVVGRGLLDPLSRALPLAGQLADLPAVLQVLSGLGSAVPVQVPSSARRIGGPGDVALLECLHELRHALRER